MIATVKLTVEECRALRMAATFGPPTRPHDVLESAKQKLSEAETKAKAKP